MMARSPSPLTALFIIQILATSGLRAQTQDQLHTAFQNIRSDNVPKNCEAAAEWLFANRDRLKDPLLDELYQTDRQGRDVILFCLFYLRGFQPDERFINLVSARLSEEDKYVDNAEVGVWAHWQAWKYIDKHYAAFKPKILETLYKTDSMMTIWAAVWTLQKQGDLEKELPNFPASLWKKVALNLNNDNIRSNAGQAIRFYLIIGKPSADHLQEIRQSAGDKQARAFATWILEAMNGKKSAYGHLGAEAIIDRPLFGEGREQPAWLNDEILKALGR